MDNPLWFKDAVIYQLHVKTFQDANGDGIGDFEGLMQRLDYLVELGVTALWLMPFFPSPLRDDGYDIADYRSVQPRYGTLAQVESLLQAAHERGLKIIAELVLNHTSDQHAWFQRARKSPPGSPEREYYVWSDTAERYKEARIIFQDFERSNWTWDQEAGAYYWHRFYSHQPDLNFENPKVHEELLGVIDFWMERGVDAVRLDAVPYLYEEEGTNCENLPGTHAFLRKLRKHIDERYPNRMLLAEANQWPEDAAAYFGAGDECHMAFHFPLMPRLFMALQMEDRFPILDILEQTPAIPANCQWAIFLRNHDELTLEMVTDEERDYMYRVYALDPRARINLGIRRRLAPLLGNSRAKIELINSLLFSMPGTPVIYYGDEIGMGDNFYLGDRDGVRTPMQWSADRNAGFSRANPQQLYLPVIIDPEYHYEAVNVENQQRSGSSFFWWMRRMLAVRKRFQAFGRGTIEFVSSSNAKCLAYLRRFEEELILVVANLSRYPQSTELDLHNFAGMIPEELFGGVQFSQITQGSAPFTLAPHGFYWLSLTPPKTQVLANTAWSPPMLAGLDWGDRLNRLLEQQVLPGYLASRRWFGGKGKKLRELRVTQNVPLSMRAHSGRILTVECTFRDDSVEEYVLVLAIVDSGLIELPAETSSQAIVAHGDSGRVLCDGLYLSDVRSELLSLLLVPFATESALAGERGPSLTEDEIKEVCSSSKLLESEQSNSSIAFGNRWFFKLFRKFERGPHPDVEISRYLSTIAEFPNVPPYGGSLQLRDAKGSGVLGILLGMVSHESNGWAFTLDALARFYERVLTAGPNEGSSDLIGSVYLERARQLGRRTAEMHRALGGSQEVDFSPAPISSLYQRSLYQAMRAAASRVLQQVAAARGYLPDSLEEGADTILGSKERIYEIFARILSRKIKGQKTRIHGDFHLGQVLNNGKDFIIIDFEGEPRRAFSERRLKRSPLVDVAGMLRSFDYAAAAGSARHGEASHLATWGERWTAAVSQAYLEGYFELARADSLISGDDADNQVLLDAFVLEKAIYEIGYELSFRPESVWIPMKAVLRMLGGRS